MKPKIEKEIIMQILKAFPTITSRVCGAAVWAFLAVAAVLSAHAGAQAQTIHFEKMSTINAGEAGGEISKSWPDTKQAIGVFRAGAGATNLIKGMRLIDLKTRMEGNNRGYAGVFRAGNDAHYLWVGVDYNNFVAKWKELSEKGLRLIDLETYEEGNKRVYAGVFRAGNDA